MNDRLEQDVINCFNDSINVLTRARDLTPNVARVLNGIVELPNLINQLRTEMTTALADLNNHMRLVDTGIANLNNHMRLVDTGIVNLNNQIRDLNTRMNDAEQFSIARALNSSSVRESSLVHWIRVRNQDLPLQCRTVGNFNRLTRDQLINFMQYYNLPLRRTSIANRRTLGRFLGLPAYV